jgi:hypothetical protein
MENKLRQNAMKRTFFFIVFLAVAIVCTGIAFSESIDEFIDRFGKEFEAKKPAPYSTLIYKQNETLMDKYDQLIMKYDKIIQQNEQIINLLSIIAKKEEVKE